MSTILKYTGSYRLMQMLVAALLLSGCGSGPPAKLYLLEPIVALETIGDDKLVSKRLNTLGISVVVLPGYASDARIAGLRNDGSIFQDDDHRWAESPEDAITRVLADRLRAHANTTVLIEPWPRDYKPTARVEVAFDRLLREPLGGADMAGQILLLSGDGRLLLKALPFQFVHYGHSTERAIFFTATAQGIDDIARMAVRALLGEGDSQ